LLLALCNILFPKQFDEIILQKRASLCSTTSCEYNSSEVQAYI
jgi:hypothetical protein